MKNYNIKHFGYILIGLIIVALTLFFCSLINDKRLNDPFYNGNASVGGGPNDDPGHGPYWGDSTGGVYISPYDTRKQSQYQPE